MGLTIRRRRLRGAAFAGVGLALAATLLVSGCGGHDNTAPPPCQDVAIALENINRFSARAGVVMIHEELPWADLLAGMAVGDILARDKVDLVNYLRGRGLRLLFMADLSDGLSRGQEPPQLRDAGRTITEPAVQQLYRDYVLGFVQTFHPDVIGLTSETNLVRASAPANVYEAVVAAANAAAADLAAAPATAPLMISVQVETAWAVLGGHGPYVGIAQDLVCFPFIQVLGLASYPYFGYPQPADIPDDYFQRVTAGAAVPVMLCERGWASASIDTLVSSPAMQASYVREPAGLLDSVDATAAVQTLFTDIDLDSLSDPYPPLLPLFTTVGLMELSGDTFVAKPALTVWDSPWALQRADASR